MPQMMPINWMLLFFLFTLIYMIFMIMNYYNYILTPNMNSFKNKKIKKMNFYWKW